MDKNINKVIGVPDWMVQYGWTTINISDYDSHIYFVPNLNLTFKIPLFKSVEYEKENYTKETLFYSFVERMAKEINLATQHIFHIIGGIQNLKEPFKTKFISLCYENIEWMLRNGKMQSFESQGNVYDQLYPPMYQLFKEYRLLGRKDDNQFREAIDTIMDNDEFYTKDQVDKLLEQLKIDIEKEMNDTFNIIANLSWITNIDVITSEQEKTFFNNDYNFKWIMRQNPRFFITSKFDENKNICEISLAEVNDVAINMKTIYDEMAIEKYEIENIKKYITQKNNNLLETKNSQETSSIDVINKISLNSKAITSLKNSFNDIEKEMNEIKSDIKTILEHLSRE